MYKPLLTPVLFLAALVGSPAIHATTYNMDVPFDLTTGFYNPSYGDIFYNAPGFGSIPHPVTLQAGDVLNFNYHYLPNQALQIERTTGANTQQINLDIFQDFNEWVRGTYNLSFEGVAGQLNGTNSYSGSVDGNGALILILNTQFTNSAFSFTGLNVSMNITGVPVGGPTFTTNKYEFQAYGDHVTPLYGPRNVPDSASTLFLLGCGFGLVVLIRRGQQRRAAEAHC